MEITHDYGADFVNQREGPGANSKNSIAAASDIRFWHCQAMVAPLSVGHFYARG